jgi:hypothetical protein
MDDRKFELIHQLMDELQDEMSMSGDELGERLGRPKQVDVMKIHAEPDGDEASPMMSGKMQGEDDDGGEGMEPDGDEMESPDDLLKRRLMKMRA